MMSKKTLLTLALITAFLISFQAAGFAINPEVGQDLRFGEAALRDKIKGGVNIYSQLAINRGIYDGAAAAFKQAAGEDPGIAEGYYNQGVAGAIRGEYDKALENFILAAELKPRFADVYYNLGLIYSMKGMYDAAIESFKKAAKLDARSAVIHNNLGVLYSQKGLYKMAIAEYLEAVKLDP
ncbi:MAG: tetratricopeptide repeat protein, partial [Candidatus Omnitrophota bacterium]